MNTRAILTVWGKELRDSLRDRRTLVSTLVIPTLLFPILSIIAGVVTAKVVSRARAEAPKVMLLGGVDSPKVMQMLRQSPKIVCVPTQTDWKQLISDKKIRAAVEIPEGFDGKLGRGEVPEMRVYHYEGELHSGMALGELRRVLSEYRDQVSAARLAEKGLPQSLIRPFDIKSQNVAPPEKVGGNAVGGIIPYLFILFCFTGALYPAIDLTAGEKERGTMETILCSPVRRIDLVLGKFLLVLSASLATVVCSLLSMGVSLVIGGLLLSSEIKQATAGASAKASSMGGVLPLIDPLGMVGVLVLVLPIAALFAALLLAISLSAKSTKEAQSLTTPLIVIIIIPAMFALLPGVELNLHLALVPILNLSLACKEMLSGVWHWHYLLLIFGSSCVYAGLALAYCVRQFNREDVLFRS